MIFVMIHIIWAL